MKYPSLDQGRSRKFFPRRGQRGYALVLVLGLLVISALLVIVMLERSSSSLKSTVAYSQASRVRALSDIALNVVKAQIWDATTTGQTTSTALAQRSTWASQPGAIRLYGPNGAAPVIYKLYSSPTLTTSTMDLSGDIPANWFSRPTEYTDLNQPLTDGSSTRYPIMNPGAAATSPGATGIVNGFSIGSTAPLATGANANPGPMPARWIYVLADGTLCDLGDPRIDKKTNPLIGRIAFWTDDETTKVNVNTASPVISDSSWDIPRGLSWATTSHEGKMAWNQPAQNEYQRYPGHPAMVSLRPILGDLGSLGSVDYFALTPRYRWGGSEDGAKSITASRTSLLTNKEDRLYVTNDELLFKSSSIGARGPVSAARLESLGFFLTSSSQAPELNLFGQPRVSIWPVSSSAASNRRTAFDNLIAFCSTIGGKVYYFVRGFPLSSTKDYLDFARNQQLYGYLQNLTANPVPGFGVSTFLSKYGTDRNQILTEIFDYIRCTNLNETYEGRGAGFQSYTPSLSGASVSQHGNLAVEAGAGFVVPIQIGSTRGGGRFPALQGAALWFVQHLVDPKLPESVSNPRVLQAALILKTTTPMHGFMPWQAKDVTFVVQNPSMTFSIQGEPGVGTFPGGVTNPINHAPYANGGPGASPGGYDGSMWPLNHTVQSLGYAPTPFYSDDLKVGSGTKFSIHPGSVKIEIRVAGQVVQSYRLNFPELLDLDLPAIDPAEGNASVPAIPQVWWYLRAGSYNLSPFNADVVRGVELSHGDARLALMSDATFSDFVGHKDYGDPTKRFAHSMRGTDSLAYLWPGGTAGSYISGLSYYNSVYSGYAGKTYSYTTRPDVPSRITDLRAEGWSGDFDNGIGNFSDGPFLNKPDEGSESYNDGEIPYNRCLWSAANGLFSPLRQVPSAVMFGSLPTGVKANIPWRTLLFCPNPRDPSHVGFNAPPDHLLLDLFRMPVVEPLSISGPASTNGKINMNYAIAPFSYIRRASSWYSVFETLKVFAIPDSESSRYKGGGGSSVNMRKPVDVEKTLAQFESKFAGNEIFRSPSQICSLFLVPQGETLADISNLNSGFWTRHKLTGDNSREKPYAELYPKLTTQSNTYRLHMRVQIIPESGTAPANGGDFLARAEYRGSILLERYLDLDDVQLSDGSVDPDDDCLNELYKFRILETRRFSQ